MGMAAGHAAPEIEAAVLAHQRAMNASRFVPETPEIYRKVSHENRLFIFNVGPWEHVRELGSAGTFRIPACPDGEDFSKPVIVPGVVEEPYPINEVECKVLLTEGSKLAEQVIGEGPFIARSSSFVPYGVFISSTPKPSAEALKKARAALDAKCVQLVEEANAAFADGRVKAAEVIDPRYHLVAARRLRKSKAECPWLGESLAPAARDTCPSCGETYTVGIMKCKCGFILDKQRYDDAVKKGLFA